MASSTGSSRYVDVNGAESEAHVPVSSTDEMDPSLAGGFRVIYDRETPFELRIQIGTLEAIKVKILILGSDTDIHVVRVELSTESDLFFLYTHTCDLESFHAMQEQQKLMVDFTDYANVLIRMLNNCIKEPHNHLAVYLMQADGRARLDFIQNMEYKFIELLSVDFMRASEDTIRQHITFRYTSMKSRLQVLQTRLHLQKTVPSPSSRNRYLTH
ncbi:hypothetical protein AM588_10010099 [Phytophthora nicotianae]|uniref:Spindle assembly abnormal protein 6 N-terminal domain-containing protein n=1 Tax=Phytophthora nicotianae TaxID=4792 RepID=A0A0W8DFI0_PHYNI|nr:hypothetical protein AM588_10010099 [Phytophthora nicotianae]